MGKKRKVNKTQLVKDYLAENPAAPPKDVAAALKGQGVSVTPAYVSTIKSSMKAKPRKKVARKKRAATGDKISLSALLEAKKLAAKLGSVEKAKGAITALSQLTD